MNILANRYDAEFRGQDAMKLRQQAEDEMNKSGHESIEHVMQCFYGVPCRVCLKYKMGGTEFLSGSRLIFDKEMIFVLQPDGTEPIKSQLVCNHYAVTPQRFYGVYKPGSHLVFTGYRSYRLEMFKYDVCRNAKDASEARQLIEQQKIDEERFVKASLREARKKTKPILEPQLGDSGGDLRKVLCREHIAFLAARSADRMLTFMGNLTEK